MNARHEPDHRHHRVDIGAYQAREGLRAQGTSVVVVSASEHTQAAGIADLFDARIDGPVVKDRRLAGKPAPDSYLEGAKALRADPGRAVVVEDALAGVEAGRAGSYALVVGLDHHDDAGEHDYADELYAHGPAWSSATSVNCSATTPRRAYRSDRPQDKRRCTARSTSSTSI